jgi:DNA-binding MarR family transcriptional regulator
MAKDQEAAGLIVSTLERLARLMRAADFDDGLNPAQWEALRYLARANRFSNSPGALTRYLGATKGTISQTIKSLERKALIAKAGRADEKRSVTLGLTLKGLELLQRDPWRVLVTEAEGLSGKTQRRMAKGLTSLLGAEIARHAYPTFGCCPDCRFFAKGSGTLRCTLFDAPLAAVETQQICVAHQPQG